MADTPRINNVPVYGADELESRIADGSLDMTRLAATVVGLQTSVTAMANWINERIQAEQGGAGRKKG